MQTMALYAQQNQLHITSNYSSYPQDAVGES